MDAGQKPLGFSLISRRAGFWTWVWKEAWTRWEEVGLDRNSLSAEGAGGTPKQEMPRKIPLSCITAKFSFPQIVPPKYMHTHTHTRTHMYTYACACVCTQVHVHSYIHTCIYTRAHEHVCTHE